MVKMKKTLEFSLDEKSEISMVESVISDLFYDNSFRVLDYMRNSSLCNTTKSTLSLSNKNGHLEFISLNRNNLPPYSTILTENEFFNIVGAIKKGISKRSGRYQESLYAFYLEAKNENDMGYISDILSKAVVFRNNLNYIKTLLKNKSFMKEWRKNFGEMSPIKHFKDTGSLRMINIIKESI